MSVLAEAISVVIRTSTLERSYPSGVEGFAQDCPNATFCTDGRLVRVGFMTPSDVRAFAASLEELFGIELVDETGSFKDVAIVDQQIGPTASCSWLRFEKRREGYSICWLAETRPGELAVPNGWRPGRSETFRFIPNAEVPNLLIEQSGAFDQMLDAQTGELRWIGRPFPVLQRIQTSLREARQLEESGDDLGALRLYESTLERTSDNASAWFCAGVLRQRKFGPGAALDYYKACLRIDPDFQQAVCNLGVCLGELGRPSEALEHLCHATDLDPDDSIAWWNRAWIEDGLAVDQARDSYSRFIAAVKHRPIGQFDPETVAFAKARAAGIDASPDGDTTQ